MWVLPATNMDRSFLIVTSSVIWLSSSGSIKLSLPKQPFVRLERPGAYKCFLFPMPNVHGLDTWRPSSLTNNSVIERLHQVDGIDPTYVDTFMNTCDNKHYRRLVAQPYPLTDEGDVILWTGPIRNLHWVIIVYSWFSLEEDRSAAYTTPPSAPGDSKENP